MPDDNRFAGLSEAVDDDDDDESDEETDRESESDESSSEADAESAVESDVSDADAGAAKTDASGDSDSSAEPTETDTDADTDDDDPAAFPFDATEKKTVYVRPETLEGLDDARALVDAQLRTEHDVRDLTGREFYDAVFRLAADDTEGLIDEILEAREE